MLRQIKKQLLSLLIVHGGADDIPDIIKTLSNNEVTGTFFTVGDWVKKYADAVKLLSDSGMEIRKSFV